MIRASRDTSLKEWMTSDEAKIEVDGEELLLKRVKVQMDSKINWVNQAPTLDVQETLRILMTEVASLKTEVKALKEAGVTTLSYTKTIKDKDKPKEEKFKGDEQKAEGSGSKRKKSGRDLGDTSPFSVFAKQMGSEGVYLQSASHYRPEGFSWSGPGELVMPAQGKAKLSPAFMTKLHRQRNDWISINSIKENANNIWIKIFDLNTHTHTHTLGQDRRIFQMIVLSKSITE
ncbi:hypothetical protein P692DRAFT_20822845 [Suillus brevipes Sb2]|nr:hypothetical protein P692DRAFT_20822845 [Suillus brevipes Sb2]